VFFLKFVSIFQAEADGLLTATIHIDMKNSLGGQSYFEEIKQLYYRVRNCDHIIIIIGALGVKINQLKHRSTLHNDPVTDLTKLIFLAHYLFKTKYN